MKKVYNWLNSIQETLFPPTCILCGNTGFAGKDICLPCHRRLSRNTDFCYRCGEHFEITLSQPTLCGRCLSHLPAFDRTYAPFLHHEEIRYLITGLKFGNQLKNARLLGGLLADYLQARTETPGCIIPMPLHPARFKERGFNQAVEIARTVSQQLNIPINHSSCSRHKDTPHQTGLTAKKRRQNLRRAFTVIKPFEARHVAILDDVMTTGATADALAAELKKAGVDKVEIWVCARA